MAKCEPGHIVTPN